MSDINPNNYRGIEAVIVGRVSAEPRYPAYDKDGTRGFKEIRLPFDQGYKKDGEWVETKGADGEKLTLWLTYTAPEDALASVSKGDLVRIDGAKLTVREFKRKDDSVGQAFDARFGDFSVIESADNDKPAF